jgi:sodium transport system permease protein
MWTWSNIRLIYLRELRDQLRDRRTMLTVVVLPLLLYPLMGAAFLQVSQFLREHPSRILVWGENRLPREPALVTQGAFALEVVSAENARLYQLRFTAAPEGDEALVRAAAQAELARGEHDLILYFPPDFATRLEAFRTELGARDEQPAAEREPSSPLVAGLPQPMIFKNTAVERSNMAAYRIDAILDQWKSLVVRRNLAATSVPPEVTQPFVVAEADFAVQAQRQSLVWSKILPFVLLVWALTGAFYPAIDLCAGEKERGTLETLLCSPALRSEIVWGKLLTIMSFSMATAVLNLAGMGFTGWMLVRQFELGPGASGTLQLGPPPLWAMGWLLLALPPMAALFSALSLAIATFARSSKEGQYYLMPLLLVMLPLMTIPILPAARLDLGTSLIPVAGLMLLLRSLMEGNAWDALRYSLPVVLVTAACCGLAIRWAVDQFNREGVLFRENDQFGLGLWVRHVFRDRGDTPNFSESLLCAVLILVIGFFGRLFATMPGNWSEFRNHTFITLVAFVAMPAVLMAIVLTRRPDKTLLLQRPSFYRTLPAAVLLAILLHPAYMWLGQGVQSIYPMSEQTLELLKPITRYLTEAPLWQVLVAIALAPALCEEVAFRGFILSGFRHLGNKWMAIALSALFFGVAHGVLQQSITAAIIGLVLGYLAIKTGSLLTVIAFHFTINALSVTTQRLGTAEFTSWPVLRLLFTSVGEGTGNLYDPLLAAAALLLGIALLFWFKSLPYEATREELLHDAREREAGSFALAHAATRPAQR